MNEIFIFVFILLATKIVNEIFVRLKLPSVVGIIVLGILCGPVLKIIKVDNTIEFFSDISILFLMFLAGLETDLESIKKQGKTSLIIALSGVFVPFFFSFIFLLMKFSFSSTYIIGLTLTATSVSITVMTLLEIGKLNTRSGITILGSAVIDDVIGILFMSISFVFIFHSGNFIIVILKLLLLIFFIYIMYTYIINRSFHFVSNFRSHDMVLSLSVILMLFLSYFSEQMGIAGITGAYVAGVSISKTRFLKRVLDNTHIIVDTLFISFFFFVVGLKTSINLKDINLIFTFILIIVSVFSKVFGCGLASYLNGLTIDESIKIGVGMIPRGEVGLVIASIALSRGFVDQVVYNGFVIMILFTTLITPFWLNYLYRK